MFALACKLQNIFAFPRRLRISRREGFSQILQQKAHVNRWFAIYTKPNSLVYSRLGITISKRIVPSAVNRNKIKRMIRECFRLRVKQPDCKDVVIRLRKSIDTQEHDFANVVLRESIWLALDQK